MAEKMWVSWGGWRLEILESDLAVQLHLDPRGWGCGGGHGGVRHGDEVDVIPGATTSGGASGSASSSGKVQHTPESTSQLDVEEPTTRVLNGFSPSGCSQSEDLIRKDLVGPSMLSRVKIEARESNGASSCLSIVQDAEVLVVESVLIHTRVGVLLGLHDENATLLIKVLLIDVVASQVDGLNGNRLAIALVPLGPNVWGRGERDDEAGIVGNVGLIGVEVDARCRSRRRKTKVPRVVGGVGSR